MTDYELHREEWIAERAGMIMENGCGPFVAESVAIRMWLEYEADRKRAQERAGADK